MLSCLKPTEAWQDMEALTLSGKHPVIFSYKSVAKLAGSSPLWDEAGNWINQRFKPLVVRCGKCVFCRRARAEEIGVRAMLEMKSYPADIPHAFITLTVSDDHMSEVFPSGRLDHRPFQLFMKRLRKSGIVCRYLMCGEYGEKTHRPHYHVILFGWCPLDSYVDDLGCYHCSRQLEQLWPFGHVMCDPVNANRIFYVAGYTLKNNGDERYAPYVRWSRRPGLGAAYIDAHGWSRMVIEDVQWFRNEKFKSWYYRTFNGRKEIRFGSRYMDNRLALTDEKRFDTLLSARRGRFSVELQNLKESPTLADLSARSLMNRAKSLNYQLARKSRELRSDVA